MLCILVLVLIRVGMHECGRIENYSVSGHGTENENVTFIVPKGVSVHFYIKQGELIPVSVAEKMWATLEATQSETYEEIGYEPFETCHENTSCSNGWLEDTTDFPSGIWKHDWPNPKKKNFIQSYVGYPGSNGAYLSDIIAQIQQESLADEIYIHWISCREISSNGWEIPPNHHGHMTSGSVSTM